jgi:membrane-associated protein
METIHQLLNFILHIDQHLIAFVAAHGAWTYGLLFAIIFCETGLVITPFLPGDSLLFAAGTITAGANQALNIHQLFILLVIASVLGNSLNYLIGRFLGPKVFHSKNSWLLNKEYLEKAHAFYLRHGGKTIILARFMPIIRTFAPFVAGIGYMSHRQFFMYNVISAILWIGSLLYVSYLFGNLPFIKDHFSTVVMAIIIISLLPAVIGFMKQRLSS